LLPLAEIPCIVLLSGVLLFFFPEVKVFSMFQPNKTPFFGAQILLKLGIELPKSFNDFFRASLLYTDRGHNLIPIEFTIYLVFASLESS